MIEVGMLTIDLSGLINFINYLLTLPFWLGVLEIFRAGGWIIILLIFLIILIKLSINLWLSYKQTQYFNANSYVIYEARVPKFNERGPEVMEQFFTALSKTYGQPDWVDRFMNGEIPLWYSFEIVSLEGEIKFYICTPEDKKNIIESAFYAAYPSGVLEEVKQDYAQKFPDFYPADYSVWAREFTFYNKNVYPIKTYPSFEHSLTNEFKDPLNSMLEILSKIGKGENFLIQILTQPASPPIWKEEAKEVIAKILGKKPPYKKTLIEKLVDIPFQGLDYIIKGTTEGIFGEETSEKDIKKTSDLPPGQQRIVKEIEKKTTKDGFNVKIRVVYIAKNENFSEKRTVALFSAFSQFSTLDMNGFKPNSFYGTSVYGPSYTLKFLKFFKSIDKLRKKIAFARTSLIMQGYKRRDMCFYSHSKPFILNTEELATIFHMPTATVRVPTIKWVESRKAEPPLELPSKGEEEIKKLIK